MARSDLPRDVLRLLDLGWYLLPVRRGDKVPCGGVGLHHASNSLSDVSGWADSWPGCSWAVACEASGLIVLDVDGEAGSAAALALTRKHGRPAKAPSPTVRTGRGWHKYYRAARGARYRNPAKGVDAKHRGYVLVPPSLHPSGKVYQWHAEAEPWEVSPPPLTEAWEALLSSPRESPVSPPSRAPAEAGGKLRAMAVDSLSIDSDASQAAARAELERICEVVEREGEGNRNNALYLAAVRASALRGILPEITCKNRLMRAADTCGLPQGEASTAVLSGWRQARELVDPASLVRKHSARIDPEESILRQIGRLGGVAALAERGGVTVSGLSRGVVEDIWEHHLDQLTAELVIAHLVEASCRIPPDMRVPPLSGRVFSRPERAALERIDKASLALREAWSERVLALREYGIEDHEAQVRAIQILKDQGKV